jgi:hypothetical protein
MNHVELITLPGGRHLRVVRHDRVEGGTKRFPLSSYIRPGKSYAYASPAYGYAQLAIATVCRDAGASFHLFTAKRKAYSATTCRAVEAGAILHPVDPGYLSYVQHQAAKACEGFSSIAELLPFGLATDWMVEGVAKVARSVYPDPSEVWIAAGSGTTWKGLAKAWPKAAFNVVQVGRKIDCRWALRDRIAFALWEADLPFDKPADVLPPFASALHYDAKVWKLIQRHATDHALFWNVAG